VVRERLTQARGWLTTLRRLIRLLGPRETLAFFVGWLRLRLGRPGRTVRLSTRLAAHPLELRAGSSDFDVFHEVFLNEAYACFDDLDDVGLIVDCGANAGYSAAYLLSRFPSARLVAIEPDGGNFELLRRNLRPYGDRVEALNAAVWSRPAELVLSADEYGDGREWSRQVREAGPGERPDVSAVDLGTVLGESGRERVSILKMDIEGAEAVVFAENVEPWIDRVDNIAIELHDDSIFGASTPVFHRATAERGFRYTRSGELTVARR
jgi:FkbM family methyltransferase